MLILNGGGGGGGCYGGQWVDGDGNGGINVMNLVSHGRVKSYSKVQV